MRRPLDRLHGAGLSRRLPASVVGGMLFGTTLCVVYAWIMVGVLESAEPLTSDVDRVVTVFQQPAPRSATEGGLNTIDDGPSVCCQSFYAGWRTSLFATILAGPPLALTGLVASRRLSRGKGAERPAVLTTACRVCLVVQATSVSLALLLALLPLWIFPEHEWEWLRSTQAQFLALDVLLGLCATPAWRRLQEVPWRAKRPVLTL